MGADRVGSVLPPTMARVAASGIR
ncbi:hypothetical protein ACFQ68_12910 [Amycolatopsis japonica]